MKTNLAGELIRKFVQGDHKCTGDTETCGYSECIICGARDCPHGEPLHYHHDGCPACSEDERLVSDSDHRETTVEIHVQTGIHQLLCAVEDWLDKSRNDECSEYMADRIVTAALIARTKARKHTKEKNAKP